MSRFLVVQHESYDSSVIYGIFDTFVEARDWVEGQWQNPTIEFPPRNHCVIEEWEGPTYLRTYDRSIESCRAGRVPVWEGGP